MTGEMAWIDQDGNDSNGECWPLHAAIARELGGELRPFDAYQGPYVLLTGARLFLTPDEEWPEYLGRVYNERTDTLSEPFPLWEPDSEAQAVQAALSLYESDCEKVESNA